MVAAGLILGSLLAASSVSVFAESVERMVAPWPRLTQHASQSGVLEGQRLSKEADRLVKEGREVEAARLYLAAHQQFQKLILGYFEQALRSSLGGSPVDEEALMRAGAVAADLRNTNLSKLWIVLDPDDRAFEQGLEPERAVLLQQFSEFTRPANSASLEDFLHRLYPDDVSGDRQMTTVRDGNLPPSKRWARMRGKEGPR